MPSIVPNSNQNLSEQCVHFADVKFSISLISYDGVFAFPVDLISCLLYRCTIRHCVGHVCIRTSLYQCHQMGGHILCLW